MAIPSADLLPGTLETPNWCRLHLRQSSRQFWRPVDAAFAIFLHGAVISFLNLKKAASLRSGFIALLIILSSGLVSAAERDTLPRCAQLVLVISPDENSRQGVMSTYERQGEAWRPVQSNVPVSLGRSGLAWGRGLHPVQAGIQKREGDGKSPAGIYRFGTIFGHLHPDEVDFSLPYVQVTPSLECVDDSGSRHYNQLVDNRGLSRDWNSSERMPEVGRQYDWGVFVEHNTPAQPGDGSCIFLHIWGGPNSPTAGCTAMQEDHLLSLLRWLDAGRQPLLLQLTAAAYESWKAGFRLP